jgi:signal transduction histidine kinase
VDAGAGRVAQYTNIPPGSYRFRVQGSNADGIWNEVGDAIEFRLRAHFYQTRWFWGLTALAAAAALVLLWRARVRRLQRDYTAALAERTKVARELHDTLLQGMSAAALRLRALARRVGPSHAAAGELAAIDSLVVTALQETRQFLGGLRGQNGSGDLADALGRLVDRVAEDRAIPCALVVEGQARPLPDEVKGDLFRIAQEAIHNAVKHANAGRIDVKLHYGSATAALTVADDGCGFDQNDIVGAADGHFGLVGMRERASRVGEFSLTSQPGQGTTIEVRVPVAGGTASG